jgi:hypothetical protein
MRGSDSGTHGEPDYIRAEAKPAERPALPVELPALFDGDRLRLILKEGHTAHDI